MVKSPTVANAERAKPKSVAKPGSMANRKITAQANEIIGFVPLPSHRPIATKVAMVAALSTLDSGPTTRT